jgi:hypothetical protein
MREDETDGVDVDDMDAGAPAHSGMEWDEVEWDGTEEIYSISTWKSYMSLDSMIWYPP